MIYFTFFLTCTVAVEKVVILLERFELKINIKFFKNEISHGLNLRKTESRLIKLYIVIVYVEEKKWQEIIFALYLIEKKNSLVDEK